MGTAQIKTPEQFLALVAPGVAAIRESLESVGRATAELRSVVNVDLKQKGLDTLGAVSQQMLQQAARVQAAAEAVVQAAQRLDASVQTASHSIERSAERADRSPRWRFRGLALGVVGIGVWAYVTEGRIQRRFDILEHNQIAIAERLGMVAPGSSPTAAAPSTSPGVARPKGKVRREPLLRFPLTVLPEP